MGRFAPARDGEHCLRSGMFKPLARGKMCLKLICCKRYATPTGWANGTIIGYINNDWWNDPSPSRYLLNAVILQQCETAARVNIRVERKRRVRYRSYHLRHDWTNNWKIYYYIEIYIFRYIHKYIFIRYNL